MKLSKPKQAKKRAARRRKKGFCYQDRPIIEANAAGIDVGAREMYVAIPPDRDPEPVRVFPTFTADLEALADWLVERGITTVAMESTGVYCQPVFNMLEGHLEVWVVNAQHIKKVPGRKTDMKDAEWIAQLLQCGLLKPSFVPDRQQRELRDLTRQQTKLVQQRNAVGQSHSEGVGDGQYQAGIGCHRRVGSVGAQDDRSADCRGERCQQVGGSGREKAAP